MEIEKFIVNEGKNLSNFSKSKISNPNLNHLVFGENRRSYLNEYRVYMARFGEIPNLIEERNINCKKACDWFLENYKSEINDFHYSKIQYERRKDKQANFDDLFFFLDKDMMVNFDINQNDVRFLFRKTDLTVVEKIQQGIGKFRLRESRSKPEILLLVNSFNGIDTEYFEIKRPKLKIEDNYNDDFLEIHKTIHKRLSKKNDKGLVLLHGKPGTGKTSYIRHLITSLKKNVIFLPPNMAAAITNPDLMKVLINNPDSVFVIEDAENIIMDREENGFSPVSTLLNLSDGLLSDCLNIQIICSFNTDLSKVDSALLRKGRLIAKYEFKELDTEKAQALSHKLGFETIITEPMSLTEIYNQKEMNFEKRNKKPIGFMK